MAVYGRAESLKPTVTNRRTGQTEGQTEKATYRGLSFRSAKNREKLIIGGF